MLASKRMSLYSALLLCIWLNSVHGVAFSRISTSTITQLKVYFINIEIVNDYGENVMVLTNVEMSKSKSMKFDVLAGRSVIIKGNISSTMQGNLIPKVHLTAFNQDDKQPLKINGLASVSFYPTEKRLGTPLRFYIEYGPSFRRPTTSTVQRPMFVRTLTSTRLLTYTFTTTVLSPSETSSTQINSYTTELKTSHHVKLKASVGVEPSLSTKPSPTTIYSNEYKNPSSKLHVSDGLIITALYSETVITSRNTPTEFQRSTPTENPETAMAYSTRTTPLPKAPLTTTSVVLTFEEPSTIEYTSRTSRVSLASKPQTSIPILPTPTTSSPIKRSSSEVPTGKPTTPKLDFCPEQHQRTQWGKFVWPATEAGSVSTLPCPYNRNASATRKCPIIQRSWMAVWSPLNAEDCQYHNKTSGQIFDLSKMSMDSNNVPKVAKRIQELSSSARDFVAENVADTATVLENIVAVEGVSQDVSENVLNTIDNILDANSDAITTSQRRTNSSSRIVQALTNLLGNMNTTENTTFAKSLKNLAIGVSVVNPATFPGVTFSSFVTHSDTSPSRNEIISASLASDKKILTGTNATSLYLPEAIFYDIDTKNVAQLKALSFVLYKKSTFFQNNVSTATTLSKETERYVLKSYVIAGDVSGYSVSHLNSPVEITYPALNLTENDKPVCVYWSFAEEGWSEDGCSFHGFGQDGTITCHCNHLTNFALLVDINASTEAPHGTILSIISYVGCSLSLLGMILTIATILFFRDLRRTVPLQILLNFCIALSFTLIVFLVGIERSRTPSMMACRVAAIALHYFTLAVFMWMAMLAFNMYRLFVKVLACYVSRFVFKCCIVAWGIPAIVVAITAGLAFEQYGDSNYCRLMGVPFLVAFFAPIVAILAGNMLAFAIIFTSLLSSGSKVTSDQKRNGFHQVRQGTAIVILLGLTWLFGALAIRDAKLIFQYLFCIFNSLQGLFVFIFYCILPPATREKYRSLCRRKRRPSRFGDESHRAMLNMETTDSYKTTSINRSLNREVKSKTPIKLVRLKSPDPEQVTLTDSFGHKRETEK